MQAPLHIFWLAAAHVQLRPSARHSWPVGQASGIAVQQLSVGMHFPLHNFWLAAAHVQLPPSAGHTWLLGQA